MIKGILIAVTLSIISLMDAYSQGEMIRIRNAVEIDQTDCNGLSKLVILLPYIQSNQYQTVSNFQACSGELLDIPESGDKYLRYIIDEPTISRSDNVFQIFNEFNVLLQAFEFDFSAVHTIYPYNTSSEIFSKFTGQSGDYIVSENPMIQNIGNNLWAEATDIIDYSRKCYEYVATNFSYLNPGTGLYLLQEILNAGGGDCGNLSSIFISLLRNKEIPARHVVTFRPDGSYHVFADFYLENYGWVPVDVTYKQANPEGDYFGKYDGLGIVAHTGVWFEFQRGEGDTYNNPLLQNFHWWYWLSGICSNINASHKILQIPDSGSEPTVSVDLLSPNGAEAWIEGSVHEITWIANGITNINIESSTNNGESYNSIVDSTPAGTGTFIWTVPETPSDNCKVRITAREYPLLSDASENSFSIESPVLDRIEISPSETSLTPAGQVQFTATGYNTLEEITDLNPQWVATGGSISSGGLFTAGTIPGTYKVAASAGGIIGNASITITHGSIFRIDISPTSSTLAIMESQKFTATGYDQWNNEITINPSWSTNGGSISSDGLFSAGTQTGNFTISASDQGINKLSTVVITPGPLSNIVISPSSARINIDETQQFIAMGYDAGNNETAFTPDWTATGGMVNSSDLGHVSSSTAEYKPTEAGNYNITCSDNNSGISGTAEVEVVVPSINFIMEPAKQILLHNYPNPFQASTIIEYSIPVLNESEVPVTLTVYNMEGRKIETLVNEMKQPGQYQTGFPSCNLNHDNGLAQFHEKIFYCRLTIGNSYSISKKMLIK
ncbi:MAG: transglutaminase domain-containing protein [Prolixibacteraceae bacterium]|nr:transglutaminase domain-containing protein [Prolixibacteraceae bacterium]